MNASVSRTARKSTRTARRPFGQGLGERHPMHAAPVDLDSMAWWEHQAAREEELFLERRFREFEAQNRLDAGLEPW